MSIKVVHGDLFKLNADILVAPVNCEGAMGAGIAWAFREYFPDMYVRYHAHCKAKRLVIGKLWHYKNPQGPDVLCFPTKDKWTNKSSLVYIRLGLIKFEREYERFKGKHIAFPPLGCGHGGLSWDEVYPMMLERLHPVKNQMDITIVRPWTG